MFIIIIKASKYFAIKNEIMISKNFFLTLSVYIMAVSTSDCQIRVKSQKIDTNFNIHNNLKLNVGQIGMYEVLLSYEKNLSNNYSVEIGYGRRFPYNEEKIEILSNYWGFENYLDYKSIFRFAHSNYFSFSIKRYLRQTVRKNTSIFKYLEICNYYKDVVFDEKYLYHQGKRDYIVKCSLDQKRYGIKLILGYKIFKPKKEVKFPIDMFFGFSLRYLETERIIYGKSVHSTEVDDIIYYYHPLKVTSKYITPGIQAGIKFGIAW